jgi:hypothetical protein
LRMAKREIECPWAKSQTTPCYLRDGDVAVVENSYGRNMCVGCEKFISWIKDQQHVRK